MKKAKFDLLSVEQQAKVARANMTALIDVKAMCSMPGRLADYSDDQLIELVQAAFILDIKIKAAK